MLLLLTMLFLLLPTSGVAPGISAVHRIPITVRETAGLRRFGYPVTAAVPFPRGALKDAEPVRLVDGRGKEVPAQVTVTARWPGDGSVRWAEVDFDASPAPGAVESYALEYGAGVTRTHPARGVLLTEEARDYQAGAFRVPKDGRPLLASVRYGDREYLRPEGTGLAIVDRGGVEQAPGAGSAQTRVVKREPIRVLLEQQGTYAAAGRKPLAFRTTMEFPSSKSWVHLVHEIQAPGDAVKEVVLRMPFALETTPRLFDFGVRSWLYGVLRPEQAATLSQRVTTPGGGAATRWTVTLGSGTSPPHYAESAPGTKVERAEGWAHLMDGQKVIAIGVPRFGATPGEYSIRLEYDGTCTIRWRPLMSRQSSPAAPGLPLRVEAYFHFIPFPAQVTAATSPPAMLAPLVARCAPAVYREAGVVPPP